MPQLAETLDVRIRNAGQHVLTLCKRLNLCRQAAEGLKYVHNKGIVHLDLKSNNIMLTENGSLKLIDFGRAQKKGTINPDKYEPQSVWGNPDLTHRLPSDIDDTYFQLAPEQLYGETVEFTMDVHSWGLILLKMIRG